MGISQQVMGDITTGYGGYHNRLWAISQQVMGGNRLWGIDITTGYGEGYGNITTGCGERLWGVSASSQLFLQVACETSYIASIHFMHQPAGCQSSNLPE